MTIDLNDPRKLSPARTCPWCLRLAGIGAGLCAAAVTSEHEADCLRVRLADAERKIAALLGTK